MIKIGNTFIKKEIIKGFYIGNVHEDGNYDLSFISSKVISNNLNFIDTMIKATVFSLELYNEKFEKMTDFLFIIPFFWEWNGISFIEEMLSYHLINNTLDLFDIKKEMIEHFEDLSNKENIQKLIKTQYEERLKYANRLR